MGSVWIFSPPNAMPSSRPNLTRLTLDEQSFQGLLSAAFTIQEHNDRRRQARQAEPEIEKETSHEPEPTVLCPHCGALKTAEGAACKSCGQDEFRPGERLQRNWASMWLMSQEQGLWPERSPENGEAREKVRRAAPKKVTDAPVKRRRTKAKPDLVASNFLGMPKAQKTDGMAAQQTEQVRSRGRGESEFSQPIDDKPAADAVESSAKPTKENEVFAVGDADYSVSSFQLPAGHLPVGDGHYPFDAAILDVEPFDPTIIDRVTGHAKANGNAIDRGTVEAPRFEPVDPANFERSTFDRSAFDRATFDATACVPATHDPATSDAETDATTIDAAMTGVDADESPAAVAGSGEPSSLLQRLADLRVTLRFHRADLYLGLAVFVAAFALLWPAAAVPHRPTLSLWDRALVGLGIAEAPPAATHFQGDPTLQVWIDPHTALYYCPGEEQYGKSADGRFTSQRDAQMDRFEPAGRSACE
ncbi:MAG: hypothetical protein WBW53_05795 [Terriglobales bacterium]